MHCATACSQEQTSTLDSGQTPQALVASSGLLQKLVKAHWPPGAPKKGIPKYPWLVRLCSLELALDLTKMFNVVSYEFQSQTASSDLVLGPWVLGASGLHIQQAVVGRLWSPGSVAPQV